LPPDTPSDLAGAGLDWTPQGAPRSRRFDDIYFSREGGLEETRAVFLQGCALPDAWRGRSRFTVAELGFGTGLNILALLELWRRHRPPGAHLSIFSVEAYPLTREEARRALAAWPELTDLAETLTTAWPRRAPGFHRIAWPELDATLDLAVGEALWALDQWTGAADAWFLDGFSPAKNPQMWRPELLEAVAARSAPGAALATFTVAGAVRRGLQAAGFSVDKRPGHGAKRERLEGRLSGAALLDAAAPAVAVIGAGIAGAALVRALKAQGLEPVLVEAEGSSGAGASGNPAALVAPALDAGGGPRARFYAQAFARAADLYRALGPDAVIGQGALQLEKADRDAARFDAVLAGGVFEDGALERLSPAAAGQRLGEPAPGGLRLAEGLWLRPAAVLDAWTASARRLTRRVAALERRDGRWALLDDDGGEILRTDVVMVACGAQAPDLLGGAAPLTPVRGQASWALGLELPCAAAWGGYALPMDGGVLFGATHDRGRTDLEVLAEDHARNLKTLGEALPRLAGAAARLPLEGRASLRATTPDRMPLAGQVGEGLYVLGGLGSRGFATAPLLAEHLAAQVTGAPSPLPLDLQRLADPARPALAKRAAGG
jgi:tRNA 5-methylaminomethyl-2-thiouridine biosynthesis bifunctional protein